MHVIQSRLNDARDLSAALVAIARQIDQNRRFSNWGIYHFSGGPSTTWHGFAEAIFAAAKEQGIIPALPKLLPLTTEQYPTTAQRPAYSVLDGSKLARVFNLPAGNWAQGTQRVIARLKALQAY